MTLISTASAQNDTPASKDGFEQRLATLDRLLEQARIKHKIPGIAIAIVKNDEVVFSKGYGHRDLESKLPVQTDTLFAIGSSTKAFTSALVAMLVDEGKMDWDDPVSKFLPDFKMNVDTGDEQITIRDLLCHRTGFTRMGVLWASGELTPEEIIKQAANAEPYADFLPVTITYSDFRDVNGLQLPFKSESENQFTGKFVIQYERAEALKELPKDAFVVPSPKVR